MSERSVYLDHAAASAPKPPEVAQAVSDWLLREVGSAGRGAHEAARRAGKLLNSVRHRLADLVNAESDERMVLATCSTDALALAILGVLDPPCGTPHERVRVVATVLEHNAVARPLTALAEAGKIELVKVPADERGFVDPRAVLDEAAKGATFVAMNWVSNVVGSIQDVGAVGRGLREMGSDALFLVDASQAAGNVRIDVQVDGIDLLAFNGQKSLRGPSGTGALYVGPRAFSGEGEPCSEPLQPVRYGGTGGGGDHLPATLPDRFEVGTQNDAGLAGLDRAIEIGPGTKTHALFAGVVEALSEIDRVRMLCEPRAEEFGRAEPGGRVGILAFNVEGLDPVEAEAIFDANYGIAVRGGLHCAPWLHDHYGTAPGGGAIRVSVGWTTTDRDVAQLVDAVREMAANAAATA